MAARRGTELLLLDEPTRGVDVGARAELYQVIRSLADEGVGVLLVSSEVPEVLGLADRVLVMREGRLVQEAPAAELDEDTVLDLVMAGSLMEGTRQWRKRHEHRYQRRHADAPEAAPRRDRRRTGGATRPASRSAATSDSSGCWSRLIIIGIITRPDLYSTRAGSATTC